jgi:hypothetical protein
MQNAECRMQNAECGMQNANRSLYLVAGHFLSRQSFFGSQLTADGREAYKCSHG